MKRIAGFLVLMLIAGCGPAYPTVDEKKPPKPDTPVVEVIDVATVYQSLADSCTKTDKFTPWINSPARLARTVKRLEGRVPGVAAKFDELFPGEASSERPLTDADVSKLRGVK